MQIGLIQQSHGMSPILNAAKIASGGDSLPVAASNNSAADAVRVSPQGKSLSELPPLLFPTRANVQKLSDMLSHDLKNLFSQAGINPYPAVEFDVDSYTGEVSVKRNRPDAQQIAELIKNNPDVELQIHNIAAISSHVVAMDKAMEADKAYRAAHSTAEINNVVARYSSIYSGQTQVTDFSLLFDGSDVQVKANGAAWLPTECT